jgi:hypothetical protein
MERLRLLLKVIGRYEESADAMEVIGCKKKSLVAMQIHWLLCKAQGRYGEFTAVVESQPSLGEVSGFCSKSRIVTDSHWVLR